MKTRLPLLALGATLAALMLAGCQTTQPLPELNPDGGPDGGNGALRLDTTQLENGILEVPYLERLQASGGLPPYRFEIQRPKVLDWVSLEGSALTGTPRELAAGTLNISVHDAVDAGVSASIPLAVVACQDGAQYPCELGDAGVCQQGVASCSAGELGACGVLRASTSVFGCGEGCGACDSALADHCQDGGTCACGTTAAPCADGTTCCPDANCVDVATDPRNCKSCGNDCTRRAPLNMDAHCGALDCEFECSSGYANCDASTGCETHTAEDIRNCGGCGSACSTNHATPACSDGTCTLACTVPYDDCDLNVGNGCETNLFDNETHCGACSNPCSVNHADPTCSSGTCTFVCKPGFANCNSLNDGCERVEDAAHCGTSCKPCAGPTNGHGSAQCSSGSCQIQCDVGYTVCGTNKCLDLMNDPNSCGTCGNVCPGPTAGPGAAACSNGTCTLDCDSGYTPCNGKCVNLNSDELNCGSCGNVCPTGDTCSALGCCHDECVPGPCHPKCD